MKKLREFASTSWGKIKAISFEDWMMYTNPFFYQIMILALIAVGLEWLFKPVMKWVRTLQDAKSLHSVPTGHLEGFVEHYENNCKGTKYDDRSTRWLYYKIVKELSKRSRDDEKQ